MSVLTISVRIIVVTCLLVCEEGIIKDLTSVVVFIYFIFMLAFLK